MLDPTTALERGNLATQCVADLDLPMPALIDRIDDRVGRTWQAHPDRLYLVGVDGKVAYAGDRGPFGFDPDALERAIVAELARVGEAADKAAKDR